MSTSSVNAALSAMVTMFRAVTADLPNFAVIDGGPIDPPVNWLCVGYDESENPGITVAPTAADAGRDRDLEAFDVTNTLSFQNGDKDATAAGLRTEIFAVFDALRAAVKADRTLGGAVARAVIGDWDLDQGIDATANGHAAAIRFTVQIDAFA